MYFYIYSIWKHFKMRVGAQEQNKKRSTFLLSMTYCGAGWIEACLLGLGLLFSPGDWFQPGKQKSDINWQTNTESFKHNNMTILLLPAKSCETHWGIFMYTALNTCVERLIFTYIICHWANIPESNLNNCNYSGKETSVLPLGFIFSL